MSSSPWVEAWALASCLVISSCRRYLEPSTMSEVAIFSAAGDLPEEVLEFAAKIVDVVRNQLPYELSPNLTFILADHIAYAVERARKQMYIRMPMAYDVQQSYPDEYRLGSFAVRRIEKEFGVGLPREEAAASPSIS